MSLLLFPALFLLAAGGPNEAPPALAQDAPVEQAAPEAKPEEAKPKMICRNERVTGSRVTKERVCRPAGGLHGDLDAATQRNLDQHRNTPSGMPEGFSARPGL